MSFEYFPVLRWKRGEQLATRRLDIDDRARMLPLVEVQSLETGTSQPKLFKQLEQAAAEIAPIGIDVSDAYDTIVPLQTLARLASSLQTSGLRAWPVVQASDALVDLAGLAHFKGQPALILRIYPHTTLLNSALSLIAAARKACGKNMKLYVVLDLDAIGEIDLGALAGMLEPFVRSISSSGEATQVAAVGGSFPYTLTGLKAGVGNRLPRKELSVWKLARSKPGCSGLAFGDYCVTNPRPLEDIDPRAMNPAAAIRYALKSEWWLLRASGVRTKGKGGMGQYNDLCRLLVASPDYSGTTFSYGDEQYDAHSKPGASSGNFMTWRRDATSHHLVYTVRQLIAGNV